MSVLQQAPGFYRRRVGDLVVTALYDGFLDIGVDKLLNIAPETAADRLWAATRRRASHSSVNAYVVQGGGRTLLIDTGAADRMGPTTGRLMANMAAAGIAPADVDMVALTHFHPDHSAGLATAAGEPVFPKAELAVAEAEAGFWLSEATLSRAPEPFRPYVLAAQADAKPYADRMVMADSPMSSVTRIALPGHTPGHSGYRIASGSDTLVIWGDVMHVPALQAADPAISMVYDIDAAQAQASRRRLLDQVASDGTLVAGMHMGFPGFHHVERDGSGYRLIAEPWTAEG